MHQNDKKKIKISIQFLRWKAVHFVAHMRENKKKTKQRRQHTNSYKYQVSASLDERRND